MKTKILLLTMFLFLNACTASKASLSVMGKQLSWLEQGEIKHVKVNGMNIRYITVGSGEPLLLIHTIRTQLDYFKKIIPALSKQHKIYALDLPGHGFSDLPEIDYTSDLFTHTVEGFMKALDLKKVTIVGESIGGAISLLMASENPGNRIKRVIAFNPYDYAEKGAGGIKRSSTFARVIFTTMEWPGIGWIVSRTENKLILKKILQGGFHNPSDLPDDLLDLFNEVGSREGYRQAEKSTFHHWKTWVDAKKKYEQIHLPVTLVYGDSDWSKIEERLENQKKIENSELIILKETGHFSALDSPEQVIQIILDHADNGQRSNSANAK